MKNLRRVLVAALFATVCLTANAAHGKNKVETIDFKEIGVDSATLSRMNDSTLLELTRMAIEHKNKKEEMEHEEQMMLMRSNGKSVHLSPQEAGIIFVIVLCSIIPIIFILLYKMFVSNARRKREEARNAMLLNLVNSGQALTPELVESLSRDAAQKTEKELSMNTSLRKLFFGSGLIVVALFFLCMWDGKEPFSSIFGIFGIFYASQGLAGYLTLKHEKQDAQQSENQ